MLYYSKRVKKGQYDLATQPGSGSSQFGGQQYSNSSEPSGDAAMYGNGQGNVAGPVDASVFGGAPQRFDTSKPKGNFSMQNNPYSNRGVYGANPVQQTSMVAPAPKGASAKESTLAAGTDGAIDAGTKAIGDGGKAAAGSGIATVANLGVGLATDAINSNMDDGKDYTYTKKESASDFAGEVAKSTVGSVAATIGGAVATGAAIGTAGVGVGAIVGAAVGLVVGGIKVWKGKKNAKENLKVKTKRDELSARDSEMKGIMSKEQNLSSANPEFSEKAGNWTPGYSENVTYRRKLGGIIHNSDLMVIRSMATKKSAMDKTFTPIFKAGGTLSAGVNVIPNGVLHEEDNSLGDKGMPVVKCDAQKKKCEKKYEIEKEELITTLDVTKKIEELAKGGKVKALGKYLTDQLLDNTHSFSEKYENLDKTT